jgi:hypothetical protein
MRTLPVFLIHVAGNIRGELQILLKKNYYLAKKAAMLSEINSVNT